MAPKGKAKAKGKAKKERSRSPYGRSWRKECEGSCGRDAFDKFNSCCTACKGSAGPHTDDCEKKSLCSEGCGRRKFRDESGKQYATCCKSCSFLHKSKGFFGHDALCDVRDNDGSNPPWYWHAAKKWPAAFHNEEEGEYVKDMGTKLIQKSLPKAHVEKCVRIEDSALWKKYADKRAEIRKRAIKIEDIKPETMDSMEYSAKTTLDPGVNEFWLFHGTSEEAATAIAKSNFKLPSCAGNFGKGAYFAEASAKSNQYAQEDKKGDCKIMMLCRVTLGNMKELPAKKTDMKAERFVDVECDVQDREFDSVLGKTDYREFLVYDVEQIYPEYIMHYK